MICQLKSPLALKDGSVLPKGVSVDVFILEDRPTVAILKDGSREIKIRAANLHRYFKEFKPCVASERMATASIVPSLTGAKVEPDGWDEFGFPSILLAAGMI